MTNKSHKVQIITETSELNSKATAVHWVHVYFNLSLKNTLLSSKSAYVYTEAGQPAKLVLSRELQLRAGPKKKLHCDDTDHHSMITNHH